MGPVITKKENQQKQTSKIQMLELSDEGFKVILINRVRNLEEKMNKMRENQGFHQRSGIAKNNRYKTVNILSEIKNSLDRLSRLAEAEEKTREVRCTSTETI